MFKPTYSRHQEILTYLLLNSKFTHDQKRKIDLLIRLYGPPIMAHIRTDALYYKSLVDYKFNPPSNDLERAILAGYQEIISSCSLL